MWNEQAEDWWSHLAQPSRPTPNQSSPVSHDGVLNNAQYRAPESDDTSSAHVNGNEEE